MTDLAISIRGVHKRFGATHAVRGLDLDVPRGSLCGFLGPNGAGKSTTIRMIMSIIYPDEGEIRVLGGSALASKDRIGYLPEERGVYRKMRVADFLHYIASLKGAPRAGLARRVTDWLDRIDLPGVARKKCQELSKGMQQKVQFLAAIMHDPELLIFDEPFSGLDPVNAELLTKLLHEQHSAGKTIIFSTHVLHQAEQLCDRIFLIHKGVKLLDASMDEIHRRFDPRTIRVVPLAGSNGRMDFTGVDGVSDAQQLDGAGAQELHVREGADPQQVMRDVLAAGPMRAVELRRLTLDEVFIRVVRQDAGDAAAAIAREELAHV